jgi:monomeric isocitrate dehydrogenase
MQRITVSVSIETLVPWFDHVKELLENLGICPHQVIECAVLSFDRDRFKHESRVIEEVNYWLMNIEESGVFISASMQKDVMAFIIERITPEINTLLMRVGNMPISYVTDIKWLNDTLMVIEVET